MTKKEFKYAMERGLGRCILELRETEDIEKYREMVMWGCTHNLAYDAQCEGTRGYYLYEMIHLYSDVTPFLQAIIGGMKKTYSSMGWEYAQACEVLELFAKDGNKIASDALQKNYEFLYNVLKKHKRLLKNGSFPVGDNFRSLIDSFVKYDRDEEKRIEKYIKVVRDFGALFGENELFDGSDCIFFQRDCEETFGKKRINKILKEASRNSEEIKRYIKAISDEEKTWEQVKASQKREVETADEIYALLKSGNRVGRQIPIMIVRRMKLHEKEAEIEKLADYYKQEQNEVIREQLLWLLRNNYGAVFLDAESVIADSQSQNEELRETAFLALSYMQDEKIYEYAKSLLQGGNRFYEAASMLLRNYHEKDKELLVDLIKKVPIGKDEGEWHSLLYDTLEIFENRTIKNPPKYLLHYWYENALCSCCREKLVKEMGKRRMLSKDILQECLYDSKEEIRSYAKKII